MLPMMALAMFFCGVATGLAQDNPPIRSKQISDLSPLKGLTNLKSLDLSGNPIPEDQKAMLRKALPNCDIF